MCHDGLYSSPFRYHANLLMIGKLKIALIFPAIVSIAFAANFITQGWLNTFGIVPRNTNYLTGIVTAPFVHREASHYLSNIVPLIILSIFLAQHGAKRYFIVITSIAIGAGLGVWIVGRPYNHIGASGVIYGLFSFLLIHGFYEKSLKSIAIGAGVGLIYSGLCISVFRITHGISWESHILGFTTGIAVAKLMRYKKETQC